MPPKLDSVVAPRASLPVPAVREAALAAIPFFERLPPLGNRQVFGPLALVQRVGCRILALADRARPLLPRSRGGALSALSAGFLSRCTGPALDLLAGLLSFSVGTTSVRPTSVSPPEGSGGGGATVPIEPASVDSATSSAARWALTSFRCTSASAKCSSEGCRCPSATAGGSPR